MLYGQMLIKIRIQDTLITAGTTFRFAKLLAAFPATAHSVCFTGFALYCVTEAYSAILAEMLRIIRILYAHSRRTFGLGLTAIQTQFAVRALFDLIKAGAALPADMLIPARTFHAVISAVTAKILCMADAAILAKAAGAADLQILYEITSSAFLADHMTFHAVLPVAVTLFAEVGHCSTGSAFHAVEHIPFLCRALLTEAAVLTDLACAGVTSEAYTAECLRFMTETLTAIHAVKSLFLKTFHTVVGVVTEFNTLKTLTA